MKYAPIVLFVYNRPRHTKETLNALISNEDFSEHKLYIFADGKKKEVDENWEELRRELKMYEGKYPNIELKLSKENKGLAKSVIGGVTQIVKEYGKVIVLEDDLVTQKYFLKVMNQMLDYYEADEKIASVTAFMQTERQVKVPSNYNRDVFFNVRPCSTGWGTWENRWRKVDWDVSDYNEFSKNPKLIKEFKKGGKDLFNMLTAQMEGKVDSWAIRWTYHVFKNKLATVQTTKSYIDNIGYDSSGVHSKDETYFFRQEDLAEKDSLELIPFDNITWEIVRKYVAPFSFGWVYIKKKVYSKLGIVIKF